MKCIELSSQGEAVKGFFLSLLLVRCRDGSLIELKGQAGGPRFRDRGRWQWCRVASRALDGGQRTSAYALIDKDIDDHLAPEEVVELDVLERQMDRHLRLVAPLPLVIKRSDIRGAVPMSNVLIVGLLVALRRRRNRPFVLGFGAFGLVAWVAYIALVTFHCHTLVRPYLFRFQVPVFDAIGRSQAHVPIFRFTAAVILGSWQFTLALIGGFISWSIWGGTLWSRATLASPR